MFKKNDAVELTKSLWDIHARTILRKGCQGIVQKVRESTITVKFPELEQYVWFVFSEDSRLRYSQGYRCYPDVSLLKLVSPPSLERASFTVLEDRGDGTLVVRKDN